MNLLRDIQHGAVLNEVDVSATLRKCKLLAARLDCRHLERWIACELEGYPEHADVPEYRRLKSQPLKGNFGGAFGSVLKRAEIPSRSIAKALRCGCTSVDIRDSVSRLEEVARQLNGRLESPLSTEVVAQFRHKIHPGYACLTAWRDIPATAIRRILDSVRDRVLDFALRIERLNPSAGDAQVGKPVVSRHEVIQIFNTAIKGTADTIVAGARAHPAPNNRIGPHNMAALHSALRCHGVASEDIRELEKALRDEPSPRKNGCLGPKVGAWVGGMVQKAVTGAANFSPDVAANVLPAHVVAYYGLAQPLSGAHAVRPGE